MQSFDLLFPFSGRRFLAKRPVPVGFIGHDFAAQDVEHLVEIWPRIDRHVQRKNLGPVMRANVGQHFVEVRVLFVDGVDDDDLRNAAVRCAIPHPLRAHANAVLRVHHHEREVRHAHRRERLADEVEITWRVENVQFLAHPRAMEQRRLGGNLVLLFAHVIIRNGGSLRDVAHAPDDAGAREHRLAQRRLAGRRVTRDGKIPKLPCRRRGHNSNPFFSKHASISSRTQAEISGCFRRACGRTSRPIDE